MLDKNSFHFKTPLQKINHLRIIPFFKCNFSCSYCSLWKKNGKEINFKLLKYFLKEKYIPEIKKFNTDYTDLVLQGGELSIKSISWFKEFISVLKELKNLNIPIHVTFLTNFYKKNNYYLELKKLFLDEFNEFNLVTSFHEEFWDIDKFLLKLLKYSEIKDNDFTCTFFKEFKDKKIYNQLFEKGIIQRQTINNIDYKSNFIKYKKFIRPVKCYAYDYTITPSLRVEHYCKKQKFSIIKFKPKEYYFCDNQCSCSSQEYLLKKEILNTKI